MFKNLCLIAQFCKITRGYVDFFFQLNLLPPYSLCLQRDEKIFQDANAVCTTHLLVEIYNTHKIEQIVQNSAKCNIFMFFVRFEQGLSKKTTCLSGRVAEINFG